MPVDDSREQAIEQAGSVIWATSRADEGTISATGAKIVATALADAHLLAGTASTTDAEDKEYLDALDVIGRLRAEVREVRAEVDAYSAARVIELEAELAALRDKVRALHRADGDGWCEACGLDYPCPTVAGDQP